MVGRLSHIAFDLGNFDWSWLTPLALATLVLGFLN